MVVISRDRSLRIRAILLSLVVLIALLTFNPFIERIEQQIQVIYTQEPVYWGTSRVYVWSTTLKLIGDSPLFGYGADPNSLTQAVAPYFSPSVLSWWSEGQEKNFNPHSLYLETAAKLGIPGLILLLVLLFIIVVPLWSAIRTLRTHNDNTAFLFMGQALFVGLIALLLQGVAIPVGKNKMLWLLMGVSVAFIQVFNNHFRSPTNLSSNHTETEN